MQKKIRSLVFSLFICQLVLAQVGWKVDVRVIDAQQKPVDGAFVRLMRAKDSAMERYTISLPSGNTEFDNIKSGSYYIYIAQTGYENYFSAVFTIDSANRGINLSDVILKSKALQEVTVVGKVPVIQRYADKTVVNVQQSVLTAASNILDIIQRSPGIQVDQNDNISMVGKSGVTVMIDGKITAMTGSDLANLLRGMPADAVDKIEFITNPSAKYDANGTAGIINIILRKDKKIGMNGTVNASYGQGVYAKTNDGFSMNDRTKSFNLFMNANYSYNKNFHEAPRTRDFYNGDEFIGGYSELDYHTIPFQSQTARIGADYFASKNTTIGFVADGMNRDYIASGNTTATVFDSAYNPESYNVTTSKVNSAAYNYSGNLNLNHKFDSVGREILLNVDYADFTSHTTQSFATNYYDLNNNIVSAPYLLYGDVPGQLNIYSFKADYDGKLGRNGVLEAGVKTSYIKTDNDLKFYDGLNSSAPLDTTQSNHFIYSENIDAAYISYARSMSKANFQIGLRAEQTFANGDQVTTNQLLHINSFQLFPNIGFNDSVSKNSQMGISFTRRLDRPSYQQLNPFRNYVDPSTYGEGNPLLLPQYAYVLQLTETYKQNYSLSLNYTHTTGVISEVWMPVSGNREPVIAETEVNLNYNDYYGVNVSAIIPIAKWWTSTNIVDVYYTYYNASYLGAGLVGGKIFADASSDNLFALKNKLSIDINGAFSSGSADGYLSNIANGNVTVGIQKKVWQSKGTIKLNATDIFYTSNYVGQAVFTNYVEHFDIKRDSRVVSIAFSYHFGGSSQSRSMRSKGGAEDEKIRAGGSS